MDKTRDRFDHHLPYEIDMLARTYAWLRDVRPNTNQLLVNVFVEAFCVHARVLMEFVACHGHKFTNTSYARPKKSDQDFHGFWKELNKQIMHLDQHGRYIDPSKKIEENMLFALNNWLSKELERFKAALTEEYATQVFPQIPKYLMVGPGTSTATNSIMVSTFSNTP